VVASDLRVPRPRTAAPAMSRLAGDLLWSDARFLWLLPLALLPFLAARPRVVRVGSTSLWRSIPPSRARTRSIPRAIAIAALLVAAAGPLVVPDPARGGLSPAAARVGLSLLRLDGEHVLDHGALGPGTIRLESARGEPWGEGDGARAGSIVLSRTAAGERGRALLPGGASVPIEVPRAPPIPSVRDESGSPAVARALAALAECGRIERLGASDPRPAAIEIASGGDRARRAGDGAARILFPEPTAERPRILPFVEPSGAAWLAGLVPERWTILAATDLPAGTRSSLHERGGGALIAEGADEIRFAFRPEESDLPTRAEWPVLLGRAIERLAPAPFDPSPPSPLPALIAALVSLGAWPFAARSRRERLLGAAAIVAAILLPPLPILSPGRTPLGDGPPAVALERAAARLRGAGTIEVPAGRPLPFEEERVAARLAARRVGLAVVGGDPPALRAEPPSIPVGGVATIRSHGGAAGSVEAVDPTGRSEMIGALASGGAIEHLPPAPGLWLYRLAGADPAALEVVAPISLLAIEGRGTGVPTGAAALLSGSGPFRLVSPGPGERESLIGELPEPPEESLVVWERADPAALSGAEAARLRAWLEAGGTLFAVAAPPFRGAEAATDLDPLLPLPLPAPPRPPRRDHGVLLLDLSGSIAGTELATLWAGVVTLVESAPEEDRLAVAGFRDECRWILSPGAALDEGALERVRGALAAGGGTRLDLAIAFARAAIESREDLARRILVVTDGRSAGADWRAIGAGLRAAGISFAAVHIAAPAAPDPDPGLAILDELRAAAGGTLRSVRGPEEATRILAGALAPPRETWRGSVGPLRAVGILAEGWPNALEGPRRRLETPDSLPTGARAALVDAAAEPIAWSRELGRGRSILLWSGLDDESLPDRRAGERYREALAAALARVVRGAPAERRSARVRIDSRGEPRLVVDRAAGDPPLAAGVAIAVDGSETPVEAIAHGFRWAVEGPDPWTVPGGSIAAVELSLEPADAEPAIRSSPSAGCAERGRASWLAFASRLPSGPERAELHPERIVWALLALIAALARNSPPHREGSERTPIPRRGLHPSETARTGFGGPSPRGSRA